MGYHLTCSQMKIPLRTSGHEDEMSPLCFLSFFFVLFIMSYILPFHLRDLRSTARLRTLFHALFSED